MVEVPEGVEIHEMAADRQETATVEDLAARAEMSGAVAEAMEKLPADQRTAIILKEYHGLTFQEVAELMNCPLEHGENPAVSGAGVASAVSRGAGKIRSGGGRAKNQSRAQGKLKRRRHDAYHREPGSVARLFV